MLKVKAVTLSRVGGSDKKWGEAAGVGSTLLPKSQLWCVFVGGKPVQGGKVDWKVHSPVEAVAAEASLLNHSAQALQPAFAPPTPHISGQHPQGKSQLFSPREGGLQCVPFS